MQSNVWRRIWKYRYTGHWASLCSFWFDSERGSRRMVSLSRWIANSVNQTSFFTRRSRSETLTTPHIHQSRFFSENLLIFFESHLLPDRRKFSSCQRKPPDVRLVIVLHGQPAGQFATFSGRWSGFTLGAALRHGTGSVNTRHGYRRQKAKTFAEQQDGLRYFCGLQTKMCRGVSDCIIMNLQANYKYLIYRDFWEFWPLTFGISLCAWPRVTTYLYLIIKCFSNT